MEGALTIETEGSSANRLVLRELLVVRFGFDNSLLKRGPPHIGGARSLKLSSLLPLFATNFVLSLAWNAMVLVCIVWLAIVLLEAVIAKSELSRCFSNVWRFISIGEKHFYSISNS
jgi:hypothetical protein